MKFSTILNVCCALIVFLFAATTTTFAQQVEADDNIPASQTANLTLQEDFGDVQYVHLPSTFSPNSTVTGGTWCPGDQSFWICDWTSDTITRADWNGNEIEKFTISASNGRALTWDGTNIWVGNASTTITAIDITTRMAVSTVTVPEAARFLTYDPDANMGAGGFWLGNWSTDIYQVDMSGNILTQWAAANYTSAGSRYGAAYDNISPNGPHIWLYNQGSTASPAVATKVHIPTGNIVGEFDFNSPFGTALLAGGLFITDTLYTGKPMLNGFLQNSAMVGVDLLDTIFVDFTVDMSLYTDPFTQVYVSGDIINGWSGDAHPMTDNGDGTWSLTHGFDISNMGDTLEFKYSLDNWAASEQFAGGEPCTITDPSGQFVNRMLILDDDITLPKYCYASCDTLCILDNNITFNINMDSAPDSVRNNFTQVYVSGTFNGWSGDANPMTDNGDGTWSLTLPFAGNISEIEWKFTADNWSVQEEFIPNGGSGNCTITTGNFTNRSLTNITGDVTLDTYCWSACTSCLSNTNNLHENKNLFQLNPSLVRDFTNIAFSDDVINQDKQVFVYNAVGQLVHNVTINNESIYRLETANYANGLYFVTVKTETSMLTKKFVVSK